MGDIFDVQSDPNEIINAFMSSPGSAANSHVTGSNYAEDFIPDAPAPPMLPKRAPNMIPVKSTSTAGDGGGGEIIPDAPGRPSAAYLIDALQQNIDDDEDYTDTGSDACSDDGMINGVETTDGM